MSMGKPLNKRAPSAKLKKREDAFGRRVVNDVELVVLLPDQAL